MKKIYLVYLVAMMFLACTSLASAESFTFAQNDNINYTFRCFDTSSNYCNSGTILVISVDVSGTFGSRNLLNNVSMTYNPTFFNVTLPTSLNGKYSAIISGVNLTSTFTYNVTPNGEDPSTAQAFFYIGLLALLVFFLIIVFWAHMQDQSELARFWWFSFMWIPIWGILFVAWNMARSFLLSQGAITGLLYYGWVIVGIVYPFFLLGLVLYTFYYIYKQKEIQDLINRGFSLEEAESQVNGRERGR